jgi:hypothetical protein
VALVAGLPLVPRGRAAVLAAAPELPAVASAVVVSGAGELVPPADVRPSSSRAPTAPLQPAANSDERIRVCSGLYMLLPPLCLVADNRVTAKVTL